MDEPLRLLPMTLNPDGTTHWNSILSPETFKVRGAIMRQPNKLIPIIVLPGIMGSNLRSTKDRKDPVWSPPNGMGDGLGEAVVRAHQNANTRQSSLHPDTTEVNDEGQILIPDDLRWLLRPEIAKQRGWGTVHWDSYGPLMLLLEEQLNLPFRIHENPGKPDKPMQPDLFAALDVPNRAKENQWCANALPAITVDDVKKLARNYLFPVHAIGYNWLQSNGQSAKLAAEKITAIKQAYEKSGKLKVKGFVVITHSMGGLVGRALVQLPSMKDLILGVVHGVQPVHGAAAVYRRLQAGTEAEAELKKLPVAMGAAAVLGWGAEDTTPVLAQSPGPLELLPNQFYNHGKPWLFAETLVKKDIHISRWDNPDRRFEIKQLLALPKADPYDEIYGNRYAWYRLVDEALLDPGDLHSGVEKQKEKRLPKTEAEWAALKVSQQVKRDEVWKSYKRKLEIAQDFHKTISAKGQEFHPCTYAHFGDDQNEKAYTTIRWLGEHALPEMDKQAFHNGNRVGSSGLGSITVDFTPPGTRQDPIRNPYIGRFEISKKDSAGDGMVPTCSGEAVEKYGLKATFRLKGLEHQKSYQHRDAQHVTLYSILQIVKEKAFDNAK